MQTEQPKTNPTTEQWLTTMLHGEDVRRSIFIVNFPMKSHKLTSASVMPNGRMELSNRYNSLFADNIVPLYYEHAKNGCDKETFYKAVYRFAEEWENERNLKLTSITDSGEWIGRSIQNLDLLKGKKTINELPKGIEEVSVFASGSSLDGCKINTGVKIACNSSIRLLNSLGATVEYLVSCDYRKTSYDGIIGTDLCKTSLVCPMHVNSDILNAFGDRVYYWVGNSTLLNKIIPNTNTVVAEDGTVTVSMLDIAVKLGAKKILLYGQDCCYGDGGVYGNSLAHEQGRIRDVAYLPLVLCNDGKERQTDYILLAYKSAVELFIASHKDVKVINMSPIGAVIEGAELPCQ